MKFCSTRLFSAAVVLLAATGLALAASRAEAKKSADAKPEPGVVATVGGEKITDQDLNSSLPPQAQKAIQDLAARVKQEERDALVEIFAQRYVQQQAASRKISEDAVYEQEIAESRASFPKSNTIRISQARRNEFDVKRGALDELINKRLEEAAAKKRGVTVEALLKAEVEDKIAPVTQADIDLAYQQNQRQFGQQTKEQVSKNIENMLKQSRMTQKRNEFRSSLRASSSVKTFLDAPSVPDLSDDDPIRGTRNAPVQIVMFSDFQCPYCSKIETTMKQVKDRYGDKVAITFRDYPLSFHPFAQKAAEASQCAHQQGKYWEYHDASFENQGQLGVPDLKKRAETLGLDTTAFNQCLDSGQMKTEVEKDFEEGSAWGVTGTPASFVNGKFLSGAQPYENFARMIDDELQLRGIEVPAATAAAPAAVKN